MASSSSLLATARQNLVELKVQLLKTNRTKTQLLDADPTANTAAIDATVQTLQSQIVDKSILVRTLSGMQTTTAVTPSASSSSTISSPSLVVGNITAVNATVSGNLDINGAVWASSVVYGTTTPFTYTGPGPAYDNGVPFFHPLAEQGTPFVTTNGPDNSVFTVTTAGTYMLQSEVGIAYPWLPDAVENTTYYVLNADAATPYGKEVHPPTTFACTRPLLLTLSANDNVRFLIDSSTSSEYNVGLDSTKLTILKLA